MPSDRIHQVLADHVAELDLQGTRKGREAVISEVVRAGAGRGPRYRLAGEGDRLFLRMNSNGYLGMSLRPEIVAAEEGGAEKFGAGPGAVRFISGTFTPHVELESRLAAFHRREAGMIFSSAYATIVGILTPLVSAETVILSDALNHNCIINAMKMARPKAKRVYGHNDMADLEAQLEAVAGTARRAIVITDGIFSMRGDHAPLPEIVALARKVDDRFPENVVVMVDDSHGVGAFGNTGRGTEEYTGVLSADRAGTQPGDQAVDVLVATLGKALGVNGGYVVASKPLVDYLRETAPMYIYSNPITPAEAAAALAALEVLDSETGRGLLAHLREMTSRFESGLVRLGYETLPGEHPVVPLMVRDTVRTSALVSHLFANGVLATGLNYPVVPRGDEEIRFQISADHTAADVDEALAVLEGFPGRGE